MLKKPSHELHGVEPHVAGSKAFLLPVGKRDRAPARIDDPVIGDSHLEHLARQVPNSLLRRPDSLDVHVPARFPKIGIDEIDQPSIPHQIPEFDAADLRKRLVGQEEV